MTDEEFSLEFKKFAFLKMYESGKISSGLAAKSLKISRIEFLELLGKHKISYFDKEGLAEDIVNV